MDVDCLAHPALLVRIGHAIAADQQLLVVEREPRDLPADHEVLEEHLVAPSPDVLGRGRILAMRLVQLANRPVAEGLTQGQDVALRVGVVDRLDRVPLPSLSPSHAGRISTPGPPGTDEAQIDLRTSQAEAASRPFPPLHVSLPPPPLGL